MNNKKIKSTIAATLAVTVALTPILLTDSTVNAADPDIVERPSVYRNVTKDNGEVVNAAFYNMKAYSGGVDIYQSMLPKCSGKELKIGEKPALSNIYCDFADYKPNDPDDIFFTAAADGQTEDDVCSLKQKIQDAPELIDGNLYNGECYIEGYPAVAGANTYYLVFTQPDKPSGYGKYRFPFTCNVDASSTSGASSQDMDNTSVQNIYRLYNSFTGEHLYTPDANEEQTLVSSHGWKSETIAWIAPAASVPDVTPVYRLYNPSLDNHLYTSDTNEIKVLTTTQGWVADNGGQPLFYSGGTESIYRMYNRDSNGLHLLTTDSNEYNTLPGQDGSWSGEGEKLKCLTIG